MRGGVGWSVPPSVAEDPPGQNLNHLPVHKPIRELEIDEKMSYLQVWRCTLTKQKGVVGGTSGPSNCAQDLRVSARMCVHVRLCLCFVPIFLRCVCVFIIITVFRFVCLSFCVCQCCKNHDRRLVYMLSESTATPPPPAPPFNLNLSHDLSHSCSESFACCLAQNLSSRTMMSQQLVLVALVVAVTAGARA